MAIINNSFQFIFIHIPKSAGTSITSLLSHYTNYCDLEVGGTNFGETIQPAYRKRFGLTKHSSAKEIRNLVGTVTWSRYLTFSFVRNPFSRCLSTYHFLRRWDSPNRDFTSKMRGFSSFEDFLMSDIWSETNGPDGIFHPQAHWLRSGPNSREVLVDYVGHVESIEDDIRKLFLMIGLKNAVLNELNVPRLNQSETESHIDIRSEKIADIILKKYEVDFEMFGYAREPSFASPIN